MITLSVECSASPVSVALLKDGKIVYNEFQNIKVTHSETLLPMIKSVLDSSKVSIKDVDSFAVAAGPGSFTGVRIGISAVKGMATPKSSPCYPVSTLYAMAFMFLGENSIICPVMDARCGQVYNAIYEVNGENITELKSDRALMCEELANELKNYNKKIILVGDGHKVFMPYVSDNKNIVLADEQRLYQNATGVALAANSGKVSSVLPENLLPVYLRLPQAERELKEKRKTK